MALPDITTPVYADIEITAEDLETLISRASLLDGFEAVGPGGTIIPLRNPSISPATNSNVSVVTVTVDARNLANGGPWTVRAKPSIANLAGLSIGAAQSLTTFNINIPNNPTPSFNQIFNFTADGAAIPSGLTPTNATLSLDSRGMRIFPSGPSNWGIRCVEYAINYADGAAFEIDFTAPSAPSAIGLGVQKALGGWGDFTDDDSLLWWTSDGSGNLMFGATENASNGAGEWVQGAAYRVRFVRNGANTNISYFKDTGNGFGNAFKIGQVATPAAVNGATNILLDAAYSFELFIQRIAIKTV